MTDDDLPVLTQVLRLGTVRQSAAIERRFAIDSPDARPPDAPLLADPLVIGNEPNQAISAYLAPTGPDKADDAVDAEAAVVDGRDHVAGATTSHAPDAFVLPQDHEGGTTGHPSALDVPAFDASMPGAAVAMAVIPAEDPAVLARRIRDAVVDDLRTRIDTELDARIAQALHAEVETMLARLQQNLRAHLADALRDVVARAVDEAIAARAERAPGA